MDMNTAVSLLTIKEDLLDHEGSAFEINRKSEEVNTETSNRKAKQVRSKRTKAELRPTNLVGETQSSRSPYPECQGCSRLLEASPQRLHAL